MVEPLKEFLAWLRWNLSPTKNDHLLVSAIRKDAIPKDCYV